MGVTRVQALLVVVILLDVAALDTVRGYAARMVIPCASSCASTQSGGFSDRATPAPRWLSAASMQMSPRWSIGTLIEPPAGPLAS